MSTAGTSVRPAVRGRLALAAVCALLGLASLLAGVAAPAAAQSTSVLVTRVAGPITPVTAGHLEDAVRAAERGGHGALVVELDTPGGLEDSMRRIVQDFLTAQVPVVVYVAPSGARAASAGAVMAFAAHVAAMSPGTNIGAATPVQLEGGEVIDKAIEDAAAYVEEIAIERGRSPEFAIDTVREGRSAGATEAVEIGAVDLVAGTLGELLNAIDGREVTLRTADGGAQDAVLATAGAELVDYDMSWTRGLLQTLANPNLAVILLSIAPLAILYELINPSGGIGAIFGGIMLILALFSLAVLPVNLVGVILLLLAAGLFAAELFAPGVGVFAAGGVVALVLGGLFLFQEPTGVAVDLSFLIPVALAAGLIALLLGRLALRSQSSPVYTGTGSTLVGATGTVRGVDGADGTAQVFVGGALWSARGHRSLRRGDKVLVVGMEGLELVVEPVRATEDA